MVQSVTAMKPRQVLLSSSNEKPLSLSSDQRPMLLQSVCSFLESNGFPKTLKKFLSEASLQKGSWNDCLLKLEDAFCMYLEARSQSDADLNIGSDKKAEKIVDDDSNIKSKQSKKKKSGKDSSAENVEVHSKEPEVVDTGDMLCEEKSSKKAKDKKKKRGSEPEPESFNGNLQTSCAVKENDESINPEKSSKSKKTKKQDTKIDDNKVEEATEDKKSSKKRKKSSADENEIDGLLAASEGSKRRKTVVGEEGTDEQVTKTTKVPDALDGQLENGQVCAKTLESGDELASKKGSAKKQNGSSEPRTQNAFQRVKVDEVEFTDERLADNSYWAKSGADTGYGAKAQEVLGQVRGRDFRHEKTKKKRGSYRGGIIDEGSHSVKFNYSDEDE